MATTCVLSLPLLLTLSAGVFFTAQGAVLGRSAHDDGVFKSVPEYANLLRRLCVHHRCTFEMVREVIGNVERAKSFWYKLVDGDQCESQPCGKGTCLDAINSYTCLCSEGYTGENCQIDTQACSYNNGGCEHFCTDEPGGRTKCWCTPGYSLQANGACEPKEEFSCGLLRVNKSTQAESRQMFGPRIVRGNHCLPGHCPWQTNWLLLEDFSCYGVEFDMHVPPVLLAKRHNGQPFCGGALVNERWVLTADHCIRDGDHRSLMADYLILGDYNIFRQEEHEQKIPICQIIRFKPPHGAVRNDYDVALIELAHPANFSDYVLPICLPPPDSKHDGTPLLTPGGLSTISGWGQLHEDAVGSRILQMAEVPFVTDATCRQAYGTHAISRRMFCAGFANGAADACAGDSGGPHVTYRGSTAFLTGIVSWGRGCARVNRYGVYARVNRMLGVIRTAMRKADASRRAGNHRCWTNVP